MAKLGAPAATNLAPKASSMPLQPVSVLSVMRPGPEPLSFVWCYRRPSTAQSPADIGIRVDSDMVVRTVVNNSPADDAQVKPGLILLKINDHGVVSETQLYVHVQKSLECTFLFFDGEPVSEIITQIATAPLGPDGRAVEPDLAAAYSRNPTRYGFLAASSPLFIHFNSRLERARAARDVVHRLQLESEREKERQAAEMRKAMAAAIDDLDDLLDDDAAPPVARGNQPNANPSTDFDVVKPAKPVPIIMTAEDAARQQPQPKAQRSGMFIIEDEEDERPAPRPPAPAPAAVPVVPGPNLNSLAALIAAQADSLPVPPAILPTPSDPVPQRPIEVALPVPAIDNPYTHQYVTVGYPTGMYPAPQPAFVVPQPSGPVCIPRKGPKPAPPPGLPDWLMRKEHEERGAERYTPLDRRHRSPPPPPAITGAANRVRRDVCLDYRRGKCGRAHCVFEHIDRDDRDRERGDREWADRERDRTDRDPEHWGDPDVERGRQPGERGRDRDNEDRRRRPASPPPPPRDDPRDRRPHRGEYDGDRR
jgi:hypothetical protein